MRHSFNKSPSPGSVYQMAAATGTLLLLAGMYKIHIGPQNKMKASSILPSRVQGNTANPVIVALPPKSPSTQRKSLTTIYQPVNICYVSSSAIPARPSKSEQLLCSDTLSFIFQQLTNPSPHTIDSFPLCFHGLTNPFSRKSFPFKSIQNPRVSPLRRQRRTKHFSNKLEYRY
jgi:hypothetical protein